MDYLTKEEKAAGLDEATAIAFDRQRVRGWYRLLARSAVVRACGYGSREVAEFDRAVVSDGPRVVAGWEYVAPSRGGVDQLAARLDEWDKRGAVK